MLCFIQDKMAKTHNYLKSRWLMMRWWRRMKLSCRDRTIIILMVCNNWCHVKIWGQDEHAKRGHCYHVMGAFAGPWQHGCCHARKAGQPSHRCCAIVGMVDATTLFFSGFWVHFDLLLDFGWSFQLVNDSGCNKLFLTPTTPNKKTSEFRKREM